MTNDDHQILLVTSGNGPGECRQAVAHLLDRIAQDAEGQSLDLDIVTHDAPHGPSSAVVMTNGDGARAFAESWEGVILWRCKSALRPDHPRKNWFIQVFVLPARTATVLIDPATVTMQAFRAGGPGGQHQNKTSSAIRATWCAPKGQVYAVVVRDNRSQHQNRRIALDRLASLVAADSAESAALRQGETWQMHTELARGNPKRSFQGPLFKPA
ncbi:MAG: peptide chain release factor-like protein [Deltaproteobacteria bacterium]